MAKLISVGKILNFHGIKGEVKMGFTAGKEDLIKSLRAVYIYINDNKVEYNVQSVRFHKNFAIIKFKEVNSVNEVMDIKGLLVHIKEDVLKNCLKNDEYLISDLVGMTVYDTLGNRLGLVSDMGQNRASDLIEIKKDNGLSFIVPFVKELVPNVDLQNKCVVINAIEGLDTTIEKGVE